MWDWSVAVRIRAFQNLLRQKQCTGWFKLAALIAFCVWQAWGATHGVIRFWPWLYHWLAHFFNG